MQNQHQSMTLSISQHLSGICPPAFRASFQEKQGVTLVVGDSMVKSLGIGALERATDSPVLLKKAYCSVRSYRRARYPLKNHEDVIEH